ncbi:hypothetical protein BDB00DRAFT_878951 [Zychaea mexicana]|uniref:uncharacterized protein n=1 Tax=Zychaea mexicana TaxID=64656 RepID=UPI0022FE0A78|nr:uncharacterized protein BDB00DRAFT_878951 [Zychaea mexicana]KAI9484322.1 hypothetical protein BDB00DRAFT_878951 [Zychaea mexicana]
MHSNDLLSISVQDNGQIILYEDEGGLLRGSVVLECRNTRIKSVTLKFQGRARCHWGQDGNHYKEERTVIEHSWSFLPPSKSTRIFHGRQKWDFCLQLPAHLPASLDRQEDRHADITYRLKAIAERPTFTPNFVVRRPVRVARCLRNSHSLQQRALFGDQHPLLEYQVSLPSIVCRPGSTIPIDFYLKNISPRVARIRTVACYLKSYITLVCRGQFVRKSSHTLSYLRDDHFIPAPSSSPSSTSSSSSWNKTEQLRIPSQIPSDVATDMIKIKHRLKVLISVAKKDGQVEEIIATIPITVCQVDQVTCSTYGDEGDDFAELLPAYQTECRSTDVILAYSPMADHDPGQQQQQQQLSIASSTQRNGMMAQLSRCPSYKSTASSRTRLSRSSLPGYDSIVSLSAPVT